MLKHILKRFFGFLALIVALAVFVFVFIDDGGWGGFIIAIMIGTVFMFGYAIVLFAECHWLREYGQKKEMIFNILFGLILLSISLYWINLFFFGSL